ncbi:MAG: phosphotransferase [Candidatus Bathyarchaeota archaeon]|jgi:aminoglycoside phosphotransferase family enzyme|nr:phosphotransferase [Candidatus Bathyarchaeota archaeon]
MGANQKQVVEALLKPDAYDEKPSKIELVQTHISFVFLTERFAYKVKKAVNFGFLDFTTLEKRRFFCKKELELNRRLCRNMYLEVVPINKSDTIKIKGEGKTIEYAVKMKRIPQERMLSRLLEENKVNPELIDKIAQVIAKFHLKADTNSTINRFGSLPIVKMNWKENFDQTRKFIEKTIPAKNYELISEQVLGFMKSNASFFEKRIADDRIRDCHGDIHSNNIFVADQVYVFDAIEFNDRFRFSDVASDVAFLAMDLDFRKRSNLSEFFVERYVKYSGDHAMLRLLPFYKCYRAYVRGKVESFKLEDPAIGSEEKKKATEEAKAYFELAVSYATTFTSV